MTDASDGSKHERIYMVISEARYRWWSSCAAREDRSLSNWLRMAGDERARGTTVDQRPPKITGLDGPQICRFEFRIAEDRKKRWLEQANREYRPLSSWLRMAGDAKATTVTKRPPKRRTKAPKATAKKRN